MYSYLFGNYFYQTEIIDMINKCEEKRKNRRLEGKTLKTSFAEDLKNLMMGIEDVIVSGCDKCINKGDCVNCKMIVHKN